MRIKLSGAQINTSRPLDGDFVPELEVKFFSCV
jgi:hypothetical protein